MADAIISKSCTSCGIQKNFSEFYKRSASKDGLAPICKSCNSVNNANWAKKNPERKKFASAAWGYANREKLRLAKDAWRKQNQENLAMT